jgi:serine protein kinase
MNWINEKQSSTEVLSFNEYMETFEKNPLKECRPTFEYLIDMLDFFGKSDEGYFNLFQLDHNDAGSVFGQKQVQKSVYQNLINFQEEGFNNKFLLLVGPNGSSKSSIVRKLMKGAEEYSKTDEGALYTFNWIFPIDSFVKGTLGLGNKQIDNDIKSYAHLEDNEINAILQSELKDHPLLLIPVEHRQALLKEKLIDNPNLFESIKKSYLYRGDLSKKNRMVYDALLKSFKGDHSEVLKYIRIEKFTISKRYSNGAVSIEPQLHVDARLQQITMDKRLASLPPSLQSLNLFQMHGEIVLANRGILEYSDLLKRPLDSYKYLLMTMETAEINLNGILTELDIFFIGTSNEIHLAAFKQHPDYNSFRGRFNFIRVPYLLDYTQEEKIYEEQIHSLKDKTNFEPLTLRTLCLFAVMTRLRCCQSKNYQNKKLSKIVNEVNPLEKALLLSDKAILPDRLDLESKQFITQGMEEIIEEFSNDNLYEGKFGLSPRDIKKIIYKISSSEKNITFIDILDELTDLILQKNDYDFLNMNAQGDFHHPARFIALLKEYSLNEFDRDLRESLGMIDDRSYEDYLKKYILNINALLKGEKVRNEITGKFEVCDDYFIKEFEQSINLKESPKTFRSQLISKLGAYSLENVGKDIIYCDVFPDITMALQESFRSEQKKLIKKISQNIVFYEYEINEGTKNSSLSDNDRDQIQLVIQNLIDQKGHSHTGALTLIKYIIKEKY